MREFLQGQLPAYMVPSAWMALDAFPLTPNGKVDRRALPAPEPTRLDTGTAIAPSSPMETMIAEVWQDVLEVEQIRVLDNFLDLGGHSLLMMQVTYRLEQDSLHAN